MTLYCKTAMTAISFQNSNKQVVSIPPFISFLYLTALTALTGEQHPSSPLNPVFFQYAQAELRLRMHSPGETRRTVIYLHKCFSPRWAIILKGQCQSFLGRVPTRWSVCWNVLLPPPCVTQISDRRLQPVRVELRILRWNFHILFSAKTGDRRGSQSALRKTVARPIRSSQSRDLCDLFGSSCTAQHFLWKSWDRITID